MKNGGQHPEHFSSHLLRSSGIVSFPVFRIYIQTDALKNQHDRRYITSLTNKSSKFYSAFAVSAALNILSFPFAILLIILITKRRVCTKSNNSLACLATTDLIVGLIVQPLTRTNFSLMHIGGRIQTVT